jgi:S-DNA-T family DNA segregation ATPase FtsK/SpoIIIE
VARSDTYGAARPTFLPEGGRRFLRRRGMEAAAIGFAALSGLVGTALYSYDPLDPAANVAAGGPTRNLLGARGAQVADWLFQSLGLAAWLVAIVFLAWALLLVLHRWLGRIWLRLALLPPGVVLAAAALATLPPPPHLPLASGLGGSLGAITAHHLAGWLAPIGVAGGALSGAVFAALAAVTLATSMGLSGSEWLGGARLMLRGLGRAGRGARNAGAWAAGKAGDQARRLANGQESERRPRFAALLQPITRPFARMGIAVRESARKLWTKGGHDDHAASTSIGGERREPTLNGAASSPSPGPATPPRAQRTITLGAATDVEDDEARAPVAAPSPAMVPPVVKPTVVAPAREAPAKRADTTKQASLDFTGEGEPYRLPPLDLLSLPKNAGKIEIDEDALQQNARLLEAVLADFGVRGQIVKVRPGPVVTLYELEPAPGTKSSRVISLSDDIARSMSAVSVRVAVIPGRNVIGIELPNQKRETVWLRELLAVEAYERAQGRLALVLGKDIGGTPVVVDLARMPHLLIAGTTGSGKSVGINTIDRKSTRLNSSHRYISRMPSSA